MRRWRDDSGVALVAALLVTMLMTAMLAGFLAMVNADQSAGGIDRDQTQAYAAAHAGVEKLTADLGQLFLVTYSPTGAQLNALTTAGREPQLSGIRYLRPNGTSGYRITYTDTNADGNPDVENPNGSAIAAGPYQGLVGLITPYQVEVTARTTGNAEVRMRRTMQTIAIPVFQFGLFSENNLSFFAGPNFSFGGRVHTNQNLFLKQDDGATLTISDRVTAVGEVIRTKLSNGFNSHNGTVRLAKAAGCPAAPAAATAACYTLAANQGSLVDTIGSAQNEPAWTNVSIGTSNGWLKNGRTGARRLDLPIVSDGATPVDLVRRPPVGEAVNSNIGRQRFYNMATLRILLSDQVADLTGLPGVVSTAGVSPVYLGGAFVPAAVVGSAVPAAGAAQVFAASPTANNATNRDAGYRTFAAATGNPSLGGYILINRQDRAGNWTDVTREVLSLGFDGRRLSTGVIDMANNNDDCLDPHPNAIIRLQRVRDDTNSATPPAALAAVAAAAACTAANTVANNATLNASSLNFWPNVLFDAREGMLRDDEANHPANAPGTFGTTPAGAPRMYLGGVMHYVELDVNNLRRWLRGDIGSNTAGCINGAGGANCPMDVTGFVVYFSDRRTNRNLGGDGAAEVAYNPAIGFTYADDLETGEFGFEDVINPGNANGTPNGALDGAFVDAQGVNRWAEDVNQSATLETYGGVARTLPVASMISVVGGPNRTPVGNVYDLYTTSVDRNVARVNPAFFFRRALKVVNGGRGNLPANGSQGLTIAAENPVYLQGNFNACTNAAPNVGNNFSPACVGGVGFGATPAVDHVSAAVIADSVTFLSNAWNDIRSFVNPYTPGVSTSWTHTDGQGKLDARAAATTWYRLAIIAGKGLSFTKPTNNPRDNNDFGTDGGAHNFIRYVENWGGQTLNYRGSLISFYSNRQGVGTYKCCDIVYSPPTRGYNFDVDFLTPSLLPPRTPMFRDVNTLTFRQILRPTQ
jgi:hypothetical protein